jgi:hypothetical protein
LLIAEVGVTYGDVLKMKIAVECQSPLLQKSLEIFLTKHLSSKKNCDIIVRDTPCLNDDKCFYIASDPEADLIKPFSKSQLILALEKRDALKNPKKSKKERVESAQTMGFEILERRIDALTDEYKKNIINTVKAFYEN